MKKATLEKVQARLGDYIETSAKQPVLILRDGEPVAMLIGLGESKKRRPAKLRDVLRLAWEDYETHGGIPYEQFWRELEKERSTAK